MTTHRLARTPRTQGRSRTRTRALIPAVALLTLPVPAFAASTDQWAPAEPVSPVSFLLVLVIAPAALFLLIALLSSIGGMVRSESSYQPGLAWRHEPEWFGGPRGALEAADDQRAVASGSDAPERGGASGRW
ncbi:MAG: hypothetical protein WBQ50_17465 [Nocardioides sp.]